MNQPPPPPQNLWTVAPDHLLLHPPVPPQGQQPHLPDTKIGAEEFFVEQFKNAGLLMSNEIKQAAECFGEFHHVVRRLHAMDPTDGRVHAISLCWHSLCDSVLQCFYFARNTNNTTDAGVVMGVQYVRNLVQATPAVRKCLVVLVQQVAIFAAMENMDGAAKILYACVRSFFTPLLEAFDHGRQRQITFDSFREPFYEACLQLNLLCPSLNEDGAAVGYIREDLLAMILQGRFGVGYGGNATYIFNNVVKPPSIKVLTAEELTLILIKSNVQFLFANVVGPIGKPYVCHQKSDLEAYVLALVKQTREPRITKSLKVLVVGPSNSGKATLLTRVQHAARILDFSPREFLAERKTSLDITVQTRVPNHAVALKLRCMNVDAVDESKDFDGEHGMIFLIEKGQVEDDMMENIKNFCKRFEAKTNGVALLVGSKHDEGNGDSRCHTSVSSLTGRGVAVLIYEIFKRAMGKVHNEQVEML